MVTFRSRRFGRKSAILAVVGAIVLAIAPSLRAAAEASWGSLFAEGQNALTQEKLDRAEDYFRQALAAVPGQSRDPADLEKCMLKLADTLSLRDKTAEAQEIYLRLLRMLESRYGTESPKIVPILFSLGSIQESAGDHAAAMVYYRRALAISQKHYGPYSPAVAGSLHRLGKASFKAGRTTEAAEHYKKALAILSQQPDLAASKELESLVRDYGDLLKQRDDSNRELIKDFKTDILRDGADAVKPSAGHSRGGSQPLSHPRQEGSPPPQEPLPQSSQLRPPHPPAEDTAKSGASAWQQQSRIELRASRREQTNEDPQVVLRGLPQPSSSATLAPAYKVVEDTIFNQSRYQSAIENYERMIATDVDALGPYHPAVANDLIGLSQLYISQERFADARPLLKRALAIYEQAYGSANVLTIKTRATLASVEFRLGDVGRAAELFRGALSNGQATLGPNNLETANILNELAYLYYHQGKLEDARTFYEWALASTEGAVGGQDPLVAACLKDYAQVLRSLGRTNEASALDARADRILAAAK